MAVLYNVLYLSDKLHFLFQHPQLLPDNTMLKVVLTSFLVFYIFVSLQFISCFIDSQNSMFKTACSSTYSYSIICMCVLLYGIACVFIWNWLSINHASQNKFAHDKMSKAKICDYFTSVKYSSRANSEYINVW